MHPIVPVFRALAGLAILSVLAAGCGGDDDNVAAIDGGGHGNGAEARTAYIHEITIPPLTADGPRCCRDFGEISKPKIEQDEDRIDNAWAELASSLDAFGFDLQEGLESQLEEGDLAIVLEHRGLRSENDTFALDGFLGAFAGDTGYDDARAGDGSFTIGPDAYDDQGNPRIRFDDAELVGGELSAGPATISVSTALEDELLVFYLHETEVEGRATLSPGGVSYEGGKLSGYILLEELFGTLNDVLNSPSCACLGLDGDPVFVQDGDGDWEAQCVEEHSCDDGACATFGGDGFVCGAVPSILQGAADLDIDRTSPNYEGLSFGMEWAAVPAEIVD